jgi:2-desacetyl-2-hydroxyethyl bacteriochlorophyllide A dehydrogenase
VRAVVIGEDRRLVLADIPEPELTRGQVRVDVARCGICGSDIHLRPSEAMPVGSVMGHEFSGRVAEVGPGVEGVAVGDRVCVFPFAPCGECPHCVAGDVNVCVNGVAAGIGLGFQQGAYAERINVPASTLVALPDELSDEHGALVEPLAVGVHGVRVAGVGPESPVAVIGAGPIGVMTAVALRAEGFERIVVVERNPHRARRLSELGFDVVGLDEVHMKVIGALEGELPHAVFECAGNAAATPLAIELVRPRGRVVLLGVPEEPVTISQLVLLVKEAQLRASFAYLPDDFARALELLGADRVDAGKLVTAVAGLEEAQAWFDELVRPETEHLKVLLRP